MPDNTPVTKAEFDAGLENIKIYIDSLVNNLKEYVDERTHDAETRLLRGFADYNNAAVVRFRKLEADTSNIDTSTTQRLGELEKQFMDFKLRLIALEGHVDPSTEPELLARTAGFVTEFRSGASQLPGVSPTRRLM